ncbi:MAG: hypothetical protein WC869_07755 [Phycisphaerae bacterium]|jgi:hypothetical protein
MRNKGTLAGVMVLLALTRGLVGQSQPATPVIETLELVTDEAMAGDSGNAWGGHQARIVRTDEGVFTAYTAAGGFDREWRLVKRTDEGWKLIKSDRSGREPVNLLAGPGGTLHIVAWPDKRPTVWTATRANGKYRVPDEVVPGAWEDSHWPYNAAGIDSEGNICIVQSCGGNSNKSPAKINLAYTGPANQRAGSRDKWRFHSLPTDFRHCYAYVIPQAGGGLSLVASRDVKYEAFGIPTPPEHQKYPYVFNEWRLWRSPDILRKPLAEAGSIESPISPDFLRADCRALDAYMDTTGRMHVLHSFATRETGGKWQIRHAVLSRDGAVLKDVLLPGNPGLCRIFQDSTGRFYILAESGLIYPALNDDGTELDKPIQLDLKGYKVEYAGYGLSLPRCGTPLADIIDGVFPSGGGKQWVYFRLRLR